MTHAICSGRDGVGVGRPAVVAGVGIGRAPRDVVGAFVWRLTRYLSVKAALPWLSVRRIGANMSAPPKRPIGRRANAGRR